MIVIGADENGLGPRLGAMIATAVTIEVENYDPERLLMIGNELGVDDSKVTSAFGKMAVAESLALAMLEHEHGHTPATADDALDALTLSGVTGLKTDCPTRGIEPCWGPALELPIFGGDVGQGRAIVDGLVAAGITLLRTRSVVSCALRINNAREAGQNKFGLDLETFERLVVDARSNVDEDVLAICGMVGGIRKYAERFRHIAVADIAHSEQVKGMSRYQVRELGDLRFEVDADGRHLPVALASMVGKYLRELSVERYNTFFLKHDPELPRASGYHDPVTTRFIDRSAELRKRLHIADRCFIRT